MKTALMRLLGRMRPRGAWVDPRAPVATPRAQPSSPEAHASGWLTSSMDLLGGAEIVEFPDSPAPDVPRKPR